MTRSSIQSKCSMCDDDGVTSCKGCSQDFCFDHLTQHRQFLNEQLGLIQNDYNEFRQDIINMKNDSQKHPLIKQIDRWESESIRTIKQKANECRQLVNEHTNQSIQRVEMQSSETNQLFTSNEKQKKNFNEVHLNNLREKLEELKKQLNQTENISIEQKSKSLISEISVRFTSKNQTWKQSANIVAGRHGYGNGSDQLSYPSGMFIDDDQTIYIADSANHRIVQWKKNSNKAQIIAGGNGQGNRIDQLNWPTNVIIDHQSDSLIIGDRNNRRLVRWSHRNGQAGEVLISNIDSYGLMMDKDGCLYVSDREKQAVRRWKIGETSGTIVAGGNGKGDRLDQLNSPTSIFIDEDHSVYVSDSNNHRVIKWAKGAKNGIVVAGGQGQGNGLRQLSYPHGIIVDQLGTLLVADLGNDRVMRWLEGVAEGTIVAGGNGRGEESNQLTQPFDLSFDRANNMYVVDFGNHRVQKFAVN